MFNVYPVELSYTRRSIRGFTAGIPVNHTKGMETIQEAQAEIERLQMQDISVHGETYDFRIKTR